MDPNMLQYLQTHAAYMLLLQQPIPLAAPQPMPSQRAFRAINNPFYKTRLCKNFEPGASGLCPAAERCWYIHPTDREYAVYMARAHDQRRRFQEEVDFLSWKAMFDEVPDAPRHARDGSTSDAAGAAADEEKKIERPSTDSSCDTDIRVAASPLPTRQQLVRAISNPKYKTKLCYNGFEPGAMGVCPYAKRCEYIHPTDPEYAAYKAREQHLLAQLRDAANLPDSKAMIDKVPDAPRHARDGSTSDATGARGDEESKNTGIRVAAPPPPTRTQLIRAISNPRYKTKLCYNAFEPGAMGVCPYAKRCEYIHPTDREYAAYANLANSKAMIDKQRQVIDFLSWKAMFDEVPDGPATAGGEEKKSVRSSTDSSCDTDIRVAASPPPTRQAVPDVPRHAPGGSSSDVTGAAADEEGKNVRASTDSSCDTHIRVAASPPPTRRPRTRKHNFLNTVLCKNFEPGATGVCPFAERCWYIHPTDHAHPAYKKARVQRRLSQSTFDEVPGMPGHARDGSTSDASGAAGDEEKKGVRSSTDTSSLSHQQPLESLLQRSLSNRASVLQSELQQQMDLMTSQLCGILGISHTPTPLVHSTALGEPSAAEHEKKMCKNMARVETGACNLGERCKDAHPRSDREDAAYREWCVEALERARADFPRFRDMLEEPTVESEAAASLASARVAPPESPLKQRPLCCHRPRVCTNWITNRKCSVPSCSFVHNPEELRDDDRSCVKCELHRKVASTVEPPLQRRVLPRVPTASTVNRMLPKDANTMSDGDRSAFFAYLRKSLQPRRRF